MITKEIELYLQLCAVQNMSYGKLHQTMFGEISWLIKHFNWSLIDGVVQTITLKGDVIRLELWDKISDDQVPLCSESVSSTITLEVLHNKLRDSAKAITIKKLNRFRIDIYKENFEKAMEHIETQDREAMHFTIDSVNSGLRKLAIFCEQRADINFLVQDVEAEIEEGIRLISSRVMKQAITRAFA
jgi:hypothetical protein